MSATTDQRNKMNTVYVVMQGEYGQGGSVIAVASSPQAARRIVATKIAEENGDADEHRDESREYIRESEADCGYEFDAAEWDAEYSKRMYWRKTIEPGSPILAWTPFWDKGGDWLKIESRIVQD